MAADATTRVSGAKRVVGAKAVLVGERHAPLRERLVRALARSMLEGHDTTAAPTLRGAEPTLREWRAPTLFNFTGPRYAYTLGLHTSSVPKPRHDRHEC